MYEKKNKNNLIQITMESIINSQLPEFKVQAYQNGSFKTISSEEVKGKWAIFFFYPADLQQKFPCMPSPDPLS